MSEVSEPDFEWHFECARARPLPCYEHSSPSILLG
jgi:hypothetical protein